MKEIREKESEFKKDCLDLLAQCTGNMVTLPGGEKQELHAESRWSERHAAYVCGLGTFGLSRGFITPKGMAGRITSIIIDEEFEPEERSYTGIYDFCIRCGACAVKCPAGAISKEYGKKQCLVQSLFKQNKRTVFSSIWLWEMSGWSSLRI